MSKRNSRIFLLFALPALAAAMLAGLAIGPTEIAPAAIARIALSHLTPAGWIGLEGVDPAEAVIVWSIRMPRVVTGALVGAALAAAGVVMQGLFRNPLAEPGLAGVSPGAVLGAVLAFVTGWSTQSIAALPAAAMTGALLALGLVYILSTRSGVTPIATLLLAGIAVGAILTAIWSLILSLSVANWQISQEILFWMMGGLEARSWTHAALAAPFFTLGLAVALTHARELDLLQQGEETAAALGVPVERTKATLAVTAAVLTGAAVAVAGHIGFVGLVVPHGVRLLVGPANRRLLPASAVAGAVFLLLCDLAARTLHPPVELRLGVLTALCGGPLFLWLLLRREGAR